jgi:hypothetical protein
MEWKWSKGESYPQSKRLAKKEYLYPVEKDQGQDPYQENFFSQENEQSAYTSSLNYDENTWDILNQSIYSQGFRQSNKREELHDKMANRDLIQQIGYNPFLSNQNQHSYVEDISIRDQYLKPINTSEGREKEENM